jgi:hypothetical protein
MTCQEYAEAQSSTSQHGDEEKLRKWMQRTGTKQCPQCKSGVSKEDLKNQTSQRKECHKMICRVCRTRFCFKCLKVLTSTYNCGCSIDRHGFVNPDTGRRLEHLSIAAVAKKVAARRAAGKKVFAAATKCAKRGAVVKRYAK